ncbi:MAG: 50S ribosomal protein L23 [Candidatus Spechtbacterales bacterium]|nr:50S ribosomal protein L23 [Candidatus Spechtbacterales bacterium]
MPILQHIFKKGKGKEQKRQQQKKQIKKQKQQPKEEQKQKKAEKKSKPSATTAIRTEQAHGAYGVVLRPHISEKSMAKTDDRKYVFEITSRANKNEVARAVEELYNTKVEKVNIIKSPAKRKRYRFEQGKTTRPDKAVVTLAKGQEIEVLPQ